MAYTCANTVFNTDVDVSFNCSQDALAVQKSVQERRLQQHGTAAKVQLWIDQELEVLVSTVAAERTLEQLLEDRAMLHEQLGQLKVNCFTIHILFPHRQISTRFCMVKD
jgi:hypothetical protein